MRRIHCIPVGDIEVHAAQSTCWCHPLEMVGGIFVHNAKDCREAIERQTGHGCSEGWINIAEVPQVDPIRIEDLAFLVRRLCRVVDRLEKNNEIREKALEYLHRHNLGGSPLR